tara:strand:- start:944 stop:1843 length:900 start_codon:yes stop_codon:yes gene_type:complete
MKKAVVVGGAGFIGSNLVDKLVDYDYKVYIIDDLSTGKVENINPKATHFNLDISSAASQRLESIIEGSEYVFHLAAKTAVQESLVNPEIYEIINCLGLLNIIRASSSVGVKRFVFSSSSSVYGETTELPTSESTEKKPVSPYALTKLIGEQYCKLFSEVYDLDTVCLRYFNVYGDRMNNEGGYRLLFPIFKDLKNKGLPLTINNDGEQRRDFIHVKDVVRANIAAAKYTPKLNGECYNVGSGKNYSVNEIAGMFGGDKVYNEGVIEPKETLACTAKIDLDLDFRPNNELKDWIHKWITT